MNASAASPTLRILCIGDIVGSPGRSAVKRLLPALIAERRIDLVIANAENIAGGNGITAETAADLLALPIAVLTGGNHTWRFKEAATLLERQRERVIRPYNFPAGTPGAGSAICQGPGGIEVAVLNLQGRVFMDPVPSPFEAGREAVALLRQRTPIIIVDMHAEATSEKQALGHFVDGRASLVVGTHTHVPTADARLLPGGTAYITDVGMTGARGGVIGVKREQAIAGLRTQMHQRFETAEEDPWLMAVLISCGERRSATAIEQLLIPAQAASQR